VSEKNRAQGQQSTSPGHWITVELPRNRILFCVRRQPRAHQLCGATGVHGRKEPRSNYAEDKKSNAVGNDRHLKKAGEDCKMNNCLGGLAVVSRPQSRHKKGKKGSDKRGGLTSNNMRVGCSSLLITKHLDTRHNTILTEREAANAMVARGAKGPRALAALHGGRILRVIRAAHSSINVASSNCFF
jgi:hypothetical protein